jgi:hypothetical protein
VGAWGRGAYVLLGLWAAFEVARSLGRADRVIFTGYAQLGEAVLAGGDPYALALNTWPPFFLFVAVPLALAARISALGALLLWQVGAVAAIWGSCRILGELFPDDDATPLVPLLMSARLLQEHLQHTQVNLFLLALVLLAFRLFRGGGGRAAAGGAALALAASTKATPIAFVPYLLYRRRWREAAWTVGFLALFNVALPAAAFGPARAATLWGSWREVATMETLEPTPHYPNQSLLAVLKRALTVEGGARDPVRYPVAALEPRTAVGLFYGVALLGALGLAYAFRKGKDEGAELAICLGALPLVTPLAWKAQFVTLLATYWYVWWALRRLPAGKTAQPGRRVAWGVWWASFACLTLSAPLLVGERLNNALESLNVITVGGLLVVGLALWLLAVTPLQPRTPANSAARPSTP